jgi:hypothetical protein
MSERALVGAVRASWVLVCAGVAALGVMARLEYVVPASPSLLAAIAALAALGLGLGALVRARTGAPAMARQATLAAAAGAVVLLILGAAASSGLASGRSHAQAAAKVERASEAAAADADRWYGRQELGALQAFALELDGAGALGKMLTDTFAQRFVPLVVGVDNRAGARPVALDLTDARLLLADGTSVAPLDRAAVLASARRAREEAQRLHGGHYLVPPGQSLGNALLFVSPETPLEKVSGVVVRIDGATVTITGGRRPGN